MAYSDDILLHSPYLCYTGLLSVPWTFVPAPSSFRNVLCSDLSSLLYLLQDIFKCYLLRGDSPNHLVKYSHLHSLYSLTLIYFYFLN